LRQIKEHLYEYNIQVPILSIDFKQAFDSIYKYKFIKILKMQWTPYIIIRLKWIRLEDSQARVVTKDNNTENLKVNAGVTVSHTV